MDDHTLQLAMRAVELGVLEDVSGARLRDELYDIFDEVAPVEVLRRLHAIGALIVLAPEGVTPASLIRVLAGCEEALTRFAPRLHAPVSARGVLVCGIASLGGRSAGERWVRHYRIGKETSHAALALSARGDSLLRALRDRRGMRDSRLFRLLDPLPVEALVCLWGIGDALVRERVERHALELAQQEMSVSGSDLIAMGAAPGEEFSAILAQARDDLLDGRVVGREAELGNLRRLAARAGILPARKGTE